MRVTESKRQLRVMAEHTAFPVWECFADQLALGFRHAMLRPDELPISESLRDRLTAWGDAYEAQPDDESFRQWIDDGRDLAGELLRELGDRFSVVYFNDETEQDEPVQLRRT